MCRMVRDLEIVESIAESIAGKNGVKVVKFLEDGNPKTVEEIAFHTELKSNEVRRILYALSRLSLVSPVREHDRSKIGGYNYKWRLQRSEIEGFVIQYKRKILERLREKLRFEESNEFYSCGNPGCPRYTFDEAMDLMFRCSRCGAPLKPYDNSELKEALARKIEEIEKTLS